MPGAALNPDTPQVIKIHFMIDVISDYLVYKSVVLTPTLINSVKSLIKVLKVYEYMFLIMAINGQCVNVFFATGSNWGESSSGRTNWLVLKNLTPQVGLCPVVHRVRNKTLPARPC